MNCDEIAEQYAKGLFLNQPDKNLLLQNVTILDGFVELLDKVESFHNFIFSPIFSKEEKKQLLKTVFETHIEPLTLKFLHYLVDKGTIVLLPKIAECYKNLAYEQNGILEIELETASPLDEKTKEQLKQKLETSLKKTVTFKEKLNPKIIGGVNLSFNNNTLNFSIKDRLAKLKMHALSETISHG